MKSMTGFGRASETLTDGTEITATIRGVNHRFLDLAFKLRDDVAPLEPHMRRTIAEKVVRGHLDISVRVESVAARMAVFDGEIAAQYQARWKEAARQKGLPEDLAASDLLGLPGVIRLAGAENGHVEIPEQAVTSVIRKALADFDASREKEGKVLGQRLLDAVERIEGLVSSLDSERQNLTARYLDNLRGRLQNLLKDTSLDAQRLEQEAALLADRGDISEEIDRLHAHLSEFKSRLASTDPEGKRLDFLAQELHRETNTAGQKFRELQALKLILDIKALVEIIKEQVQNVE